MARRLLLLAAIALGLGALLGCTTRKLIPVHPLDDGPDPLATKKRAVQGYVTRDGVVHELDGYVEVHGDSLRFVAPRFVSRTLEADRPGRVEVVHRDSVQTIFGERTDPWKTTGVVVALLAFGTLVVGLAIAGMVSQEPLV